MKTKKIVALLLSLAVMLASFSLLCVGVSAVEVQNQIDIPNGETTYTLDGVNYTVVRSAAQMNELAAEYTSGGKNYILDADLVYSEETPYEQIHLANGSLNGNGHSITGVNIKKSATDGGNNISMFKFTNNATVTVSNLTVGAPGNPVSVTATDAISTNGSDRVGTLFGYFQGTATIENVTVYSNVSATEGFRAGGLIGDARGTLVTINNCIFNGTVTVGSTPSSENCVDAAGGLIGYSWSMSQVDISNSFVYGEIVCECGGAGGLYGEPRQTLNITNCANYADVTGQTSGGIVGDPGVTQKCTLTLTNCFNAGSITGSTYAGGLAGTVAYDATYSATLIKCANIGTVKQGENAATSNLYGYVRTQTALTVTDCNAYGTFENDTDAAAALTFMQTNCGFAMFAIENNKIVVKTVPAEAKFLQYKKDADANTMDIRVLGVINDADLTKYANVGFNVSVYDANGDAPVLLKEFDPALTTTTTVYKSVKANEGGSITTYSASDLGATYLYALELQGIPMTGSYVFEITAFATEGDTPVYDSVVTVTVVGGNIQ